MFDSAFEILCYASYITILGVIFYHLSIEKREVKFYRQVGVIALILSLGKGFYFAARTYALLNGGIENNMRLLGWGKEVNFIISITFFAMLYEIAYKQRIKKKSFRKTDYKFYVLVLLSIFFGILPWNNWASTGQSVFMKVLCRVPILLYLVMLISMYYFDGRRRRIKSMINISAILIVSIVLGIITTFKANEDVAPNIFVVLSAMIYPAILLVYYFESKSASIKKRLGNLG